MQARRLVALALVMMMLAGPTAAVAQDDNGDDAGTETLALLMEANPPPRDVTNLAMRYRLIEDIVEVEPAPAYAVDDVARFWVAGSRDDREAHREINAVLLAASGGVYIWVEQGVNPDRERAAEAAQALDQIIFPSVRALLGEEARPGVDGDEHIYIVHTQRGGELASFDPNDTLPRAVSWYANERDMLTVSLEMGPDFIGRGVYYELLAYEFARLVLHSHDAGEAAWLDAGLATLASWTADYPETTPEEDNPDYHQVARGALAAFLDVPETQLTAWDTQNEHRALAHQGAAFLFALYVYDRFGGELIGAWAAEPAHGLDALDAALDAVGAEVGARQVFADWVMANALNTSDLGEGQYTYTSLAEGQELFGVAVVLEDHPLRVSGAAANPFGAQYAIIAGGPVVDLHLDFDGSTTTPVLPLEPHSGDYLYWSNRQGNMDSTLTRAFDLSGVDVSEDEDEDEENKVTLTFWAWYDIKPYWDYAYVSVSADGGASWEALSATSTTPQNPHRQAFGAGFTGAGGGAGQVPYPLIGVTFDAPPDTETTEDTELIITGVTEDGPAEAAGLQVGDVVMSVEGMRIEKAEDVRTVIDAYNVGDAVTVSVLRDGKLKHITVTLGANPYQYRPAPLAWMEETVDLSGYAGEEILVRFEYVTTPGAPHYGIAIDDIALDAIGYSDDAEDGAGGWDAAGWVRMDNKLPARFIVQFIESGGEVQQVLGPDDTDAPRGAWTLSVGGGRSALLVVAGATPFTTVPEAYMYTLRVEE